MCNISAKEASFAIVNDSSFIIPNVNRLVEESHERLWVGAHSNRGFQDDIEEVSEKDDESEGSSGALPPRGSSEVIAGGRPTFVRFLSIRLGDPISLACFLSLGAVGCMSGSSMSESSAGARTAEILMDSSSRMSR